jgi:alkanesulfonate monooxygenase SsuD/methylene tetrahydromethanopterin reductase-like flavin-dependent oxidoreductase (luciferase family)
MGLSVPTLGDVDDDKVRAAMLDEALIIVDGLWSGAPVSVDGTFYQVRDVDDRVRAVPDRIVAVRPSRFQRFVPSIARGYSLDR